MCRIMMQTPPHNMQLFSLGHSKRSWRDFCDLLRANGITALVDVRSRPASRFCPWFSRPFMEPNLSPIKYVWLGASLGGLDADVPPHLFREGIDALMQLAESETVAFLCSERDPKKCHRSTVIQIEVEALGAEVIDIGI